jgi:hypothetical protein
MHIKFKFKIEEIYLCIHIVRPSALRSLKQLLNVVMNLQIAEK